MYRFKMESEKIEHFRDAENIQEWTKGQTLQHAAGVFWRVTVPVVSDISK